MTTRRIPASLLLLWLIASPLAAGKALADDFEGSSLDKGQTLTAGITDGYKFILDLISLQKGPALTLAFSPVTTFAKSETFGELYRLHQASVFNWRRFAVSATVAPLDGEGELATELGTWGVGVQWPIVDTTGIFYGDKTRSIYEEMKRELDILNQKAGPRVTRELKDELTADARKALEQRFDETCLSALPSNDTEAPPSTLESPWAMNKWIVVDAASEEGKKLERILSMAEYGCRKGNLASIEGARRNLVALVGPIIEKASNVECHTTSNDYLSQYTIKFPALEAKWKDEDWLEMHKVRCRAKMNEVARHDAKDMQDKVKPLLDAARSGGIIALDFNYLSAATVAMDIVESPSVERSRSWTADIKASYRWYRRHWALDVTAIPFAVEKAAAESQVVLEHKAAVTGELLREQLNGDSLLLSGEASFQTNAPEQARKETTLRSRAAFPLGNGVFFIVSLSGTRVEASGWERETSLSVAWSYESGGKKVLRSIDFFTP